MRSNAFPVRRDPMPTAVAPVPQKSAPLPNEHQDVIHDTQFDYYGQYIATASSDRTVGIYRADSNSLQRIATLSGHEGPVWMVAWAHPRFGSVLASAGYDHKAIVWKESPPRSQVWRPVHIVDAHNGSVNAIHWAPEEFGPILATASTDGAVAVTAYQSNAWQPSIKISNNSNEIAHAMGATGVSFAPFEARLPSELILASCGCDSKVRLWISRIPKGHPLQKFELLQVLEGHSEWVRDVAFCPVSPSTRFLMFASCGQDNKVIIYRKLWDQLEKECCAGQAPIPWEQSVIAFKESTWRLSWAPTGEILVVTTGDSEVFILQKGVEFTAPWIKIPISEYQQ